MTPAGGRAVRRALTGRFVLCTLLRSDDSRFARLHIDAEQHVLGVAFYRPSGALLSAVDSSYAATSPSPANVKCGSSAQATIGSVYWKKTRKWWIGATPGGMNRDAVVKRGQERAGRMDERHQLVRHQGPGEPARVLSGKDVGRRG